MALRVDSNEVVLKIFDDGVGFDPLAVRQKDTLGLLSMRERAKLVRGQLLVSSNPGKGTAVELRVPLAPVIG